jgi:hypothetical protein
VWQSHCERCRSSMATFNNVVPNVRRNTWRIHRLRGSCLSVILGSRAVKTWRMFTDAEFRRWKAEVNVRDIAGVRLPFRWPEIDYRQELSIFFLKQPKISSFWRWRVWIIMCATSLAVPGSTPGGVTGFFSDIFLSDRTMALGSTQSLVKMSTRDIFLG